MNDYAIRSIRNEITKSLITRLCGGSDSYKYTANTYVVDFNSNGGNTISSKNVTYDSTYGILETPTKTGYTFDGWYTQSSGGTKVSNT